ncbi:MAG: SDR family oxidoreductase [Solirubrobacteraceae bacterium]
MTTRNTPPPQRDDTVLLTGATGFLGMELLARLLDDTDRRVLALIRARSDDEAQSRLRTTLAGLFDDPAPHADRVVALRGDLTSPGLGLDPAARELALGASEIIHGAASVTFDLPLDESRAINVDGTRRMLDLAEEAHERGTLRRFTYVSTAYVAGDCGGRVREQAGAPRRRFRNSYEHSKSEAETLVQARLHRLPVTIARPSIVVGDRMTGWTASFNVIYSPLRAFASGAFSMLPARRRSPVDVVSVDYVARAVLALSAAPEAAGGTFHVVAGDRAHTVGELLDDATERFGQRRPTCVSPRLYRTLLHPLAMRRSSRSARRLLKRNEVYFPYFGMRMRFDDQEARAILDPLDIRPEPLLNYFGALVEFAQAASWGRRPIGRAQAQMLARTAPAQTSRAQLRMPGGVHAPVHSR